MVRSRLRNKFLKLKTDESRKDYQAQRNYCVSLLRKTKKNFYENLNPTLISDNRNFWKYVKPLFSDKTPMNNVITLIDDNEITSNNISCAEIPSSYLRDNTDVCAGVICNDVNRSIEKGCFPANLKKADITPIFKKGDRLLKTNYRPVSILATLAKVYEKLLYLQINDYFDRIFSKYLGGFRKRHCT